ncbi:DUF2063 domain-containing protein [Vibrio sp. RE86]|uniref:HvfC/BufC N-terminal domain-containing protein n=1 Tax=Vibrio sp. RE86 TaxID=2607605 RepID=UPI0014934278|nr:DNA-binding domain-containing protein [Vibrio sp. RE86]NOH81582.1 DUF2063 domain-containing protein [Vibrio sp. RE86]
MTPSLAELQQQFAQALHYQRSGEECHIISDTFSADERVQIYRNNFVISLSEVLAATYPMVNALLGEECLAQLARQHVLHYPLVLGDVTFYGEHFNETIEAFPSVVEAAPYSPEVARFEWQIDLAQQQQGNIAPTDSLLPLSKLSDITPEEQSIIHLHLSTGVVPFHSSYALFSLKAAIENGHLEGFDIHQAEQGVICCTHQGSIWTQAMNQEAYELLQYLHSGCTLGEIPPEHLTHLNFLVESNLIAGFSLAH